MTNLDDRHTTLREISERDPLRSQLQTKKIKTTTFKVGEQATTTKKTLPRRKRKTQTQRHGAEEDLLRIDDPFERYHIPKTRCAMHSIPVLVDENEGDPALNVSVLYIRLVMHLCSLRLA